MDQTIKIVDEHGVEKEFRYLFGITRQETDEPYGYFVEINSPRPEVVVYKFNSEGQMKDLETQEEWQYAQQVFDSYIAQMHGGCGGCHGGCHDDDSCGCGDDCSCEGDCGCN
ncbi:MAG: hypothetical protein U0L85_11440 [Bacilli bacterium]|nr:hypothetical protein [Bacilli bacterium]